MCCMAVVCVCTRCGVWLWFVYKYNFLLGLDYLSIFILQAPVDIVCKPIELMEYTLFSTIGWISKLPHEQVHVHVYSCTCTYIHIHKCMHVHFLISS